MVAAASNVEPLLLTANAAADSLAISAKTLWRMTKSGQVPCVRIGRAVRYSPKDLAVWVECRTRGEKTLSSEEIAC